jgi:hypothetical protein
MDELVDKDNLLKKGKHKQLMIWTSIWEMPYSILDQGTCFPSRFSSLALHSVKITPSLEHERFVTLSRSSLRNHYTIDGIWSEIYIHDAIKYTTRDPMSLNVNPILIAGH